MQAQNHFERWLAEAVLERVGAGLKVWWRGPSHSFERNLSPWLYSPVSIPQPYILSQHYIAFAKEMAPIAVQDWLTALRFNLSSKSHLRPNSRRSIREARVVGDATAIS
jgi:hypothetical protein